MKRWVSRCRASFFTKPPAGSKRLLSSYTHEQVQVRTGSVGFVSIDLFNISKHAPDSPLIVHLPSFPAQRESIAPAAAPSFLLRHFPIANINYRWESSLSGSTQPLSETHVRPLCWPSPVHDVAFAFAWLVENLAPPANRRRDMYVYGSNLGASLAASLGLTEAHSNAPFGVRGFVAHNGVYNWTMFLPDHRINKPRGRAKLRAVPLELPDSTPHMEALREQLSSLFQRPTHLFDPFASPALFFHGPGLDIPQTFGISTTHLAMIDAFSQLGSGSTSLPAMTPPKPPRKSHLVFPPRKSSLKIPPALLLHDAPSMPAEEPTKGRKKKPVIVGNTFRSQAQELAEYMRRSIEKIEFKERIKWDDDVDSWEEEARQRVRVEELGDEQEGYVLGRAGQETVIEWLEERA
jgi:hypothetical protein